jgi:Bacterial SH3 domain
MPPASRHASITGPKAMSSEPREIVHLPMCIEPRRQVVPGRGGRWRHAAVLLVVLALAAFALRTGSMGAAPGIGPGVEALHDALGSMVSSLERLPQDAGAQVEGEIGTLARSVEDVLLKARQLPAPMVDPAASHEIAFVRDLVRTTTIELDALAFDPAAGEPELAAIHRLSGAARARLAQLDAAVEERAAETRRAIVTIEERPGALLVSSIDRRIHDGARAAGIMLFLIGILVVGLRVLGGTEESGTVEHRLPHRSALASSIGAVALVLFMAGSFTLAIRPELVVAGSAQTEVRAREDACQRLAVEREQLRAAQTLGTARLIAVVEQRVEGAAAACPVAEVAMAGVVESNSGRPLPPQAETSGASPPGAGGAEAGARAGSELSRLIQVGEAHATEMPGNAGQPPTGAGRAAKVAGADLAAPMAADEVTGRARSTAAAGEPQATSDAVPLPREPAPRMPMPAHPAPREFVTTTSVNYRAGPSRSAPKLGTLADGTSVHMVDHTAEWSIVRLGDGRSVYVASAYLERAD